MLTAILFSMSSQPDYIQALPLANLKAYALSFQTVSENWRILTEFSEYPALSARQQLVEKYYAIIEQEQPTLLAFSCYLWNMAFFIDLLELVRKRLPEIKILLGGHQISYTLIEEGAYDQLPCDFAIVGEGEKPFARLLSYLTGDGKAISKIQGLVHRQSQSDPFTINPPQLPSEDFNLFPRYYKEGLVNDEVFKNPHFVGIVETLRGCRFKCAYCTYNMQFGVGNIQYREVNDIIEDLRFLDSKMCHQITLVDSNFGIDLDRAKLLVREILKNKLDIWYYSFSASPGHIDDELADLFGEFIRQRPGNEICVNVGLQTTNKQTLSLLNRSPKIDRIIDSVGLLKRNQVYIKLDTILGLPNDSADDIADTIDFSFNLFHDSRKHVFAPNILELLPGSRLEKICREMNFEMEFKPHEIYGSGSSQFYQSATIPRDKFVHALRQTAVACRLLNYNGWSAYKYNIKPERQFQQGSDEIVDLFMKVRNQFNISNIQLVDLLIEQFLEVLDEHSLFKQADFSLPDYWWWYLCDKEIPTDTIVTMLNRIAGEY